MTKTTLVKPEFEEVLAVFEKIYQEAQRKGTTLLKASAFSERALTAQEDAMEYLEGLEQQHTNVKIVQKIFETREKVWDYVEKVLTLESYQLQKALIEGNTPLTKTEKKTCKSKAHEGCCCHKHAPEASQEGCCCHEDGEPEKKKVKKTCRKKK